MPPKKKRSGKKRGKGPVWNAVKRAASAAHNAVKNNKVISKGLKAVGNPYYLGSLAQFAGYGRGGSMQIDQQQGAGFFGDLGSALGGMAGNALGGVLGFGRRRRKRGRGLGENEKVVLV